VRPFVLVAVALAIRPGLCGAFSVPDAHRRLRRDTFDVLMVRFVLAGIGRVL